MKTAPPIMNVMDNFLPSDTGPGGVSTYPPPIYQQPTQLEQAGSAIAPDMQGFQQSQYQGIMGQLGNRPQGVEQMLQPLISQVMQQSQQETSEKIPAYLQQVSELTNTTFPNLFSSGIGSVPNQITGSLQSYQNPSMMRALEVARQQYGAFGV